MIDKNGSTNLSLGINIQLSSIYYCDAFVLQAKVVACNATAYCPDGNTCCRLPSGQWGCCPSPNAVCCSDRLHCCPHGYTCTSTSCSRGSDVTKLFKKKPAIQVSSK